MGTEKNNVYHLWLTPDSEAHHRFAEVILRLSQTYHSRLFNPHITLAGGITGPEAELLAKTEKLSQRLTQILITPQEVSYLNEIYRSLFLLVTPSKTLITANEWAKQLFGLPLDDEFMPHLSLFYGNLPVEEKEKIKCNLNTNILTPFLVKNIVLFCTNDDTDAWHPVQSFPIAAQE